MQESLPERPENRSAAIVWLASPPGQVLKSATTPRLNLPYASRKRNSYETNVEKFSTTLPCSWGHSPEVWFGGSKALLKVCSSRDLLNPVFGQLPDCRPLTHNPRTRCVPAESELLHRTICSL
jgi:hypothetical protein